MKVAGSRGASLAGLARLRQGTYRLLATLLLYPDPETLRVTPEAARSLGRASSWAAGLAFYGAWDNLLRQVANLGPTEAEELQEAYSVLFVGNAVQKAVSLCESAYVDPLAMPPGQLIAQVETDYAAAGLHVASRGQAPDHATVELEFVSFLCGVEADAWNSGLSLKALDALERQRRFLGQHLGQWLPSLARSVTSRDEWGFYSGVTRVAWTLAAHDVDFVTALTTYHRSPVKTREEFASC
ncbi:MAG: molecular chaperone TorD family protein [Chloroflexi bacterium]|nr:molecular chaperone TorD family protein [Chloroflexota bacterium]